MPCCFGGPNSIGLDIANLKPGDVIIILAGDGDPKVERDTIDTIWIVSGYSALTAGGRTISCNSVTKVVRTGLFSPEFPVSDEALKIHRDALAAKARFEEEFGRDGYSLEFFFGGDWDNFPSEPE